MSQFGKLSTWLFVVACVVSVGAAEPAKKAKPADAEIERARKVVKILDDVYKQTVVLITDKYVNKRKTFPPEAPLWRCLPMCRSQVIRRCD
jgi:hypothetical protein